MSVGEADFGLEISKGVLAKFAMAAIGFAGSIVFARVLGPRGYGAFYVVVTLVNILDNPVTGWGVACKKRISEQNFPTAEALGSGLIGATVLPLIILPAVYLFHRFTGLYDLSGLVLPFSVLFVTVCFFAVTNRILTARANFSAAEWSDTLRSLLTTPFQLVLVYFGLETIGMIYGLTLATLLTIPYVLYSIGVRPTWPSLPTISSISSYAKFSIPNGFIGTAQSRIDILLLGALLSSSAVGNYQVSMQLTMAGTFIGGVASRGLMARVSDHWSRDNSNAVVTDVTNSLGFASILAIPIFFGAAAMPDRLLVTVFGSQYSDVGLVLVGLALFRVLNMQSRQLASTIGGIDRPDINTRVGGVVLILNIVLGYILLLEYGILGVVIATVITEIIRYFMFGHIIKNHFPEIQLFPKALRHQLLAGAIMFVFVDGLHTLIGISWWGELLFLVGSGAGIYSITLIAISKQFRVTAYGVISDVFSG